MPDRRPLLAVRLQFPCRPDGAVEGLAGFRLAHRRWRGLGSVVFRLSAQRSLVGHAGYWSDNGLIDGIADIKIGGRNNGQRG